MTTTPLPRLTVIVLACFGGMSQAQSPAVSSASASEVVATAAKEPGAVRTDSGMVIRTLKEGQGASPQGTDTVRVHYRGAFPDGREFDSSHRRGQPAEFPLNRVIPCWTEGVQKIKVGGSAKLTCPPELAYGARGAGNAIPPNATLQFEVELLSIVGR